MEDFRPKRADILLHSDQEITTQSLIITICVPGKQRAGDREAEGVSQVCKMTILTTKRRDRALVNVAVHALSAHTRTNNALFLNNSSLILMLSGVLLCCALLFDHNQTIYINYYIQLEQ